MADTLRKPQPTKSVETEPVSKVQGLKVIGAGFGRTGTFSLKAALEELGFAPCYHMVEVFQHPEHVKYWKAATQGESIDWDQIFVNYQATVDWPSCTFYAELMSRYPDAKVVLTVRDPDRWYESCKNTLYMTAKKVQRLANNPLRRLSMQIFAPRFVKLALQVLSLWNNNFYDRFEDKDYTIATYNRHIEEVKRNVSPERLLVYEVKEGWEPLCVFLGVEVPEKPFPHLNESGNFVGNPRWQRVYTRIRRSLIAAGVLVALWITLGIWRALSRRDS